jgi:hypothetical protein
MKNELEHIDNIFRNNITNEPAEFHSDKGWKRLKDKLLLNELAALNLTNVSRKLIIITGIIFLLLSLMLPYMFVNHTNSQIIHNSVNIEDFQETDDVYSFATYDILPDKNHYDSKFSHNKSGGEIVNIAEENLNTIQYPTSNDTKRKLKNSNNQIPQKLKQPTFNITILKTKKGSFSLNYFDPKITDIVFSVLPDTNIDLNNTIRPTNDDSKYFTLGVDIGSTWNINDADIYTETIQPLFDGGFIVKYHTKNMFISAALNIKYYKSTYSSNYTYDTLLGNDMVIGYEIVKVIDDMGDTVYERQYYSGLFEVYDTIKSSDQVMINSYSTALNIPVTIGTSIFQYRKFRISVTGGVLFSMLISNSQLHPKYAGTNREIIGFDTNPTINYVPVFHIQGGLLFEYKLSNRFNFELSSTYSHKIGYDQYPSQNPESLVRMGLGISYKF